MAKLIFRNLISNAIKFSKPGSSVKIYARAKAGITEISINDEGVGVRADRIPTLFGIDRAFSTKGTSGEKGTGLGLILCREFAEMNNAAIDVQSEEGKGSTFTVSFPVE